MEGKDFLCPDSVGDPIRKLDFDLLHPPITGLPDDFCPVDDAENIQLFRLAGYDVRFNLRALQPDQRTSQSIIATTIGYAVRRLQEVISLQSQRLGRRLTVIDRSD